MKVACLSLLRRTGCRCHSARSSSHRNSTPMSLICSSGIWTLEDKLVSDVREGGGDRVQRGRTPGVLVSAADHCGWSVRRGCGKERQGCLRHPHPRRIEVCYVQGKSGISAAIDCMAVDETRSSLSQSQAAYLFVARLIPFFLACRAPSSMWRRAG
jgi:hypothetical protein